MNGMTGNKIKMYYQGKKMHFSLMDWSVKKINNDLCVKYRFCYEIYLEYVAASVPQKCSSKNT